MENDRRLQKLIASARQGADVPADVPGDMPEEDEALAQDGPIYLTWFTLGHVLILGYLASHALLRLTPSTPALFGCGAIGILGLMLVYAASRRFRLAAAEAEDQSRPH